MTARLKTRQAIEELAENATIPGEMRRRTALELELTFCSRQCPRRLWSSMPGLSFLAPSSAPPHFPPPCLSSISPHPSPFRPALTLSLSLFGSLQMLADFLTIIEHYGSYEGMKLAFVGDCQVQEEGRGEEK
eukprot:767676-Hanusia_phi.AAC.2